MTKTPAPAKTPTVAIARVLRGLGLKQGSDFRVKGEYKGGERTGTVAVVSGIDANQLVADNADSIERLAAEAGYHFNVSIHFTPSGSVWVWVSNIGQRTRQTHFLSPLGRTTNTGNDLPAEDIARAVHESASTVAHLTQQPEAQCTCECTWTCDRPADEPCTCPCTCGAAGLVGSAMDDALKTEAGQVAAGVGSTVKYGISDLIKH